MRSKRRSLFLFSGALRLLGGLSLVALAAGCPAPPGAENEVCDDQADNDGNGFIDCNDPVCFGEDVCNRFERCDDRVDNDEDGLVDCLDNNCAGADVCFALELCSNGSDDDFDTAQDCDDQDCFGNSACPLGANQAILDLNQEQDGLQRLVGDFIGGATFGHPTEAGDVNGDGLADVVSCAMAASPFERERAGAVDVYLAGAPLAGAVVPTDPQVVRIFGARAFDLIGASAHVADVTGDGLGDIIIGAQGDDGPNDILGIGAVYVIAGSANLPKEIDLAAPPAGVTVSRITGERQGDRLGIWVGAGDIDGDGIQDLLLGANQSDGPALDRPDAGASYVVRGGALPAELSLTDLTPGQGGLLAKVYGEEEGDHLGGTLFGGDLNGDGFADLAVAAAMNRLSGGLEGPGESGIGAGGGDGPDNSRNLTGDVHIFYGPLTGTTDLAEGRPAQHTLVFGAGVGDTTGEELVLADMDNDGDDELLLGALTFSRPGSSAVGATYIIPADLLAPGVTLDLATPPGGVITFIGDEQGEISGDTLAAPDVDGDGIRELAVARPSRSVPRDGSLVPAAGRVDLFFNPLDLPGLVDLRSPLTGISVVELWGIDFDDTLAYSMTSADVDGDGKEELLPNVMRGDGIDNLSNNVGEIYVVSGALIRSLVVLP